MALWVAGTILWALVTSAVAAGPPNLPHFSLTDTDGHLHTQSEWTANKAVVLLFVSTDCPLSNRYVPEFKRLESSYRPRGVMFLAVQGDATVSSDEVRRHAREYAYTFPYLLDPSESLAAFTGATTTPEAAVLSSRGELRYLGRIDNRLEDFGHERVEVTQFDLADAIDAVLAGKPVPHPRTKALGCAITRR